MIVLKILSVVFIAMFVMSSVYDSVVPRRTTQDDVDKMLGRDD